MITGKEARINLANELEVEYFNEKYPTLGWNDANELNGYQFSAPHYKFRLKPRTIEINGIEVPAPFEPKEGEEYWWINPNEKLGYDWDSNDLEHRDYNRIAMGVWSTEDEIKQVVAALRSVFK